MLRKAAGVVVIVVGTLAITAAPAVADPELIKCPNNTHIWGESTQDCNAVNPIGGFGGARGGARGGSGGSSGLLGVIRGIVGGIL